MELKLGKKIIELRKKKGMTQEQLAGALGVSAPAVSKWETDSSYPDITLLCPLARALDTDVDSLLAFEEDMSEADLGQYMTEIIEMIRGGRIPEAEERLNGLLHAYPSNIPLKFSAVAALTYFEINAPEADEADKLRWKDQKKQLVRAVHDDGNPAYYPSAVSMLVSMALAEDQLEEAERLLKETMADQGDFTFLWSQLYLKKGEKEKALGTVQRRLYSLVNDMRTCLMAMLGQDMNPDLDRAVEICDVLQMLDSIFRVGGGMGDGLYAEIYLRAGKMEEALAYLERLADRMTGPMEPPNPLLFAPEIAPGPEKLEWNQEILMAALRGLETDACFEPLRKQECFQRLVELIRKQVQS